MGCCGGKPQDIATTTTQTVVSLGDVGVVAGGIVAGGVLGGPIGAAIGCAIAVAAVGTIGRKTKDVLGVRGLVEVQDLDKVWRALVNSKEVMRQLPIVGLLRIDRGGAPVPPVMLDTVLSEGTNSKLFRVKPVTVAGLDYATVRAGGTLTDAQSAALDSALKKLEKAGAIAVTGDCGLLAYYQSFAAKKTKTPVLLSPLLQAPLLASVLDPKASILVVTSDSTTFGQADLEKLLLSCQLVPDAAAAKRFVLQGCEDIPGFVDPSVPIDVTATQAALLSKVASVRNEQAKKGAPLGGVLFESAMLPAFSDSVRKAAKLPVCDNLTLADFAMKAQTDNPRFGITFGPKTEAIKMPDKSAMPAIGILRIDYTYPAALGDAAHPNSYYYRTPHATWNGLSFEAAQAAKPLTKEQRHAMVAALTALEKEGVMGIAGDCGFLMNYQEEARAVAKVPTFISALLQCSILTSLFSMDECILVLTANGRALLPHMPKLLSACGVTKPEQQRRFIVAGCESLPGFDAVAKGEKVDVELVMPHVVSLVQSVVAKNPLIRAVLLECTELPPYADAIRHAVKLPVLDAITLVDFFHAAIDDNPYWGIDWEKLASTPSD